MPLQPDVVVMMHNINDLMALIYDRTYWSHNPSRAAIVNFSFYKNLKGLKALAPWPGICIFPTSMPPPGS